MSCSALLGAGGLGRHSAELLDAFARRGVAAGYLSERRGETDAARSRTRGRRMLDVALRPLTFYRPAWRAWKESVLFDRDAARRLPHADHFLGFNGSSLAQLRAAGRAGDSLSLVAANPHFTYLMSQHARAFSQYPVDRSYATRLARRNLREYDQVQRIYVASQYVWESFLEQGTPAEKLSLFPLTPAPRFTPGETARGDTFNIVFVGSLTVDKGVPLLLDAFTRLPFADARLVLVGGWTTTAMRRHVQAARAADSRIELFVGDPLPHLRAARLYAHPAYAEGFGYAAAEAFACGVPVLVSQDTGMKELLGGGQTGMILPTGDLDALAEAMAAAYRGEILGG